MDINPIAVVSALHMMAKEKFFEFEDAQPGENEKLIAKKLLKSLHTILTDFVFADDNSLEVDPNSQCSSQGSIYDDSGMELRPTHTDGCSLERKIEILRLIDENPNWSLKTIQTKGGKEFKHACYKKRWEEQVKAGETKYEKYKAIDDYTAEKFTEARGEFQGVRETDLRLWALQAFIDNGFVFKASPSWITRFKQKHGISSRKVTKLVTRRDVKSLESIVQAANEFQAEIKIISPSFNKNLILNTDQVGFSYEQVSNRTLSHKGEKITMAVAKSPTNLVTHSYTAQYLITMDGRIVGDVFLCLQERSGRLGDLVQRNLFPASNVTVTCSTSGKLTTSLYEYFLDKVVLKNVEHDFLFIVDSWGGHTDYRSYASRFGIHDSPKCTLKIIPKKCTSLCQPLDTTFHRQLKYFTRTIFAEASLYYSKDLNSLDEITTRNNIIRMHSLVHNQLCAPIFQPMIRYAWFSSGLTEEKPTFDSVKQACFTFPSKEYKCSVNGCKNHRFIKCSHCRKIFCFPCFFYNYHFH